MKHPNTSLFAVATTGAVLLIVRPASAQSYTNNFEATSNTGIIATETSSATGTATQAYTIATEATHTNYVKESASSTASTNTNPLFLLEVSAGSSYGYTSGANYTMLASTIPSATGTTINGEGTFVNGQTPQTGANLSSNYNPTVATYSSTVQAYSGSQSELVSYVQNNTATTSFYRLETANAANGFDALSRPTVDLGGTVSFMIYFDPGPTTGTTASSLAVELGCNETSTATTLGAYGGSAAQTNLVEYDSTVPGAATGTSVGPNSTGPTSFPSGGFSVSPGSWQKVTFNLHTDPATAVLGSRSTVGFGYLDNIDFSTTGSAGQVYNIYIDDLTITPAATPEPTEWAAMGAGTVMLLGLGVRARRRATGCA